MGPQGTKVGSAYIEVVAKTDKFANQIAALGAQTKQQMAAIQSAIDKSNEAARRFGSNIAWVTKEFDPFNARLQIARQKLAEVESLFKSGGISAQLYGKAQRSLNAEIAALSSKNPEKALARLGMEARGAAPSIIDLKTSLIALASGMVFNSINDISDAFSLMRSRIRLVTQEGESLYDIEDKLAKQAMTNRADLKETVGLYTRLRQSRADLTDAATQDLVDKWSKSLIISASSAQEAASSTQQFAQAMAAGTLQGQELRSVIQGNSAFAVYLAGALGVTTGQLKQMGEEGKLTTDVLIEGMTKAGDVIQHDFAKKAMTIHQAMTNIETATVRLVGTFDQMTQGSAGTAYWINQLAMALESFTLYLKGSTPAIQEMHDQIDKANKVLAETKDIVDKGAIRDLGDQADGALPGLTEVEEKIKAIRDRMKETGAAGKQQRIGALEATALDTRIKAEQLEKDLERLLTLQVGRGGDAGMTQGTPQQISKSRAELQGAFKVIADLEAEIQRLRGMKDESFRDAPDKAAVDLLQTQLKLELARARGQEAEVARLEDVLMREKLITEFKAKGVPIAEAEAKAASHVANLRKAMNSESEKERKAAEAEASLRFQLSLAEAEGDKTRIADLETQLEINRRALELEEQGVAVAAARAQATEEINRIREATKATTEKELAAARDLRDLEYQMALAAANGDEQREKALQRELDIRRQMKDLINLGYGEVQARAVATYRVDSLTTNPDAWVGFERGIADATKRGLITAIETGDWGDAFGDMLTDITRDALNRALDVLWEALAAIKWDGTNGGWGGFFNMVGSSIGGSFKPMAGGGPVRAGELLRVGEMGSEWFRPKVDGDIIPQGAQGKSLGAPMQISVGGAQVIIQGDASERTAAMIAESLSAYTRALPQMIDQRVTDRQKRGAY